MHTVMLHAAAPVQRSCSSYLSRHRGGHSANSPSKTTSPSRVEHVKTAHTTAWRRDLPVRVPTGPRP